MVFTKISVGFVILALMGSAVSTGPTDAAGAFESYLEPHYGSVESTNPNGDTTFDVSAFAERPNTVTLRLVPGQSDYAACAGVYTRLSVGKIRNRPIYHKASAPARLIFYSGSRWVVTAAHYAVVILNGATGGFYWSQPTSGDATQPNIWLPRYTNN